MRDALDREDIQWRIEARRRRKFRKELRYKRPTTNKPAILRIRKSKFAWARCFNEGSRARTEDSDKEVHLRAFALF